MIMAEKETAGQPVNINASATRSISAMSTRIATIRWMPITQTVYEEISGGAEELELGKREIHGARLCRAFNFKGTDHRKSVGQLSGGERNRVHLAKLLKSGGQRAPAR